MRIDITQREAAVLLSIFDQLHRGGDPTVLLQRKDFRSVWAKMKEVRDTPPPIHRIRRKKS